MTSSTSDSILRNPLEYIKFPRVTAWAFIRLVLAISKGNKLNYDVLVAAFKKYSRVKILLPIAKVGVLSKFFSQVSKQVPIKQTLLHMTTVNRIIFHLY